MNKHITVEKDTKIKLYAKGKGFWKLVDDDAAKTLEIVWVPIEVKHESNSIETL